MAREATIAPVAIEPIRSGRIEFDLPRQDDHRR